MINLDQRPEKFEQSSEQLHPFGIFPYRFSAVNGWELTWEELNDVGVKFTPEMEGGWEAICFSSEDGLTLRREMIQNYGQVYFGLSRGAVGIALSHLSILQDAYDSGYETIWVMEDDVKVIRDPRNISNLIEMLDAQVGRENWDILFTDRDSCDKNGKTVICRGFAKRPNFRPQSGAQYYQNKRISKEFRILGARFGAYSMIIRRCGMEKILNFFKEYHLFNPYDIDNYVPEGMKMYTVLQDIVTTIPDALSDNMKPNYNP